MKPLDYNIILFYGKEIYRLRKYGRHLAAILVGGTLAEIIAREIGKDYEIRSYERVLQNLLNNKKITKEQYDLFDKIRKKRIEYAHLHGNEVAYGMILDINNNISKDIYLNSKVREEDKKNFEEMFKFRLQSDSNEMIILLNKLIKSFYHEIFNKMKKDEKM